MKRYKFKRGIFGINEVEDEYGNYVRYSECIESEAEILRLKAELAKLKRDVQRFNQLFKEAKSKTIDIEKQKATHERNSKIMASALDDIVKLNNNGTIDKASINIVIKDVHKKLMELT